MAALIAEHPGLQAALGGAPSVGPATGSLGNCARTIRSWRLSRPHGRPLREVPDIGRDVAIDASDLPAFANGQRYVSQHGPERERFSDPDASWGHRSAVSTRREVASTATSSTSPSAPAPACRSRGASRRAAEGIPLRRAAARRRPRSRLPARDVRDGQGLRQRPRPLRDGERGCHPIIPLRGTRGRQIVLPTCERASRLMPTVPRHTQRFRDLYRGRAAVEREFGA